MCTHVSTAVFRIITEFVELAEVLAIDLINFLETYRSSIGVFVALKDISG